MTRSWCWFAVVVLTALLSACASVGPGPRFLSGRLRQDPAVSAQRIPPEVEPDSIRSLNDRTAPPRSATTLPTVESADVLLSDALLAAIASPSPVAHRRVARQYIRLGILDRAADYLTAALRMDSRDAAAYELRARLWRDAGLLGEALGDAYRAVYFGGSASSQNTLGTILHYLNHHASARERYRLALKLDSSAFYAVANLCAVALDDGDTSLTVETCSRVLEMAPGLAPRALNLRAAAALEAQPKRCPIP